MWLPKINTTGFLPAKAGQGHLGFALRIGQSEIGRDVSLSQLVLMTVLPEQEVYYVLPTVDCDGPERKAVAAISVHNRPTKQIFRFMADGSCLDDERTSLEDRSC